MNSNNMAQMNLVLSPVSIPDLVALIATEIETRLFNRNTFSTPPPTAEPVRLYGDRAASNYLGCTPLTVQNLRKRGAIPFYRYGRKVYFLSSELDQALKVENRRYKNRK